jgi:hypothetical protein
MTFHVISIIFVSTDNFFTSLERVQYNKHRFKISATSKGHTRKADIYGNFAEKSLNQQFEDNMTRSGHIAL